MALASSGLRLGARRLFLELGATGTHQLRILGQVLILVDTRAYLKKRHCFTPPLKALSRLTYAGDNPKRRENSGLKASVVSTPDPITQSGRVLEIGKPAARVGQREAAMTTSLTAGSYF